MIENEFDIPEWMLPWIVDGLDPSVGKGFVLRYYRIRGTDVPTYWKSLWRALGL